jgi:multidrug efflux system outer membrane protein
VGFLPKLNADSFFFDNTSLNSEQSFTPMQVLRQLSFFGLLTLASCSLGPNYKKPATTVPNNWKDQNWKVATPGQVDLGHEWWKMFGDAKLNELASLALANNQELKAAVANVERARALARVARSEFLPMFSGAGAVSRQRSSETSDMAQFGMSLYSSTWSFPIDLSYEIDLFGRVRRSFEVSRAEARAAEADAGAVLLAISADVASNYFTLRSLDAQLRLLRETIQLRRESLDLVQSQVDAGAASDFELSQAETELSSTEAGIYAVEQTRREFENALAVLTGRNPSEFKIEELPRDITPLRIPAGLPSELLERRPDVASAEHAMAASSARIGVAKAAFFPSISLTGNAGYSSASLSDVFRWGSRTWAFGPSVVLPLFVGGRNIANLEAAKAQYEAAVAIYRQQVLVAFRDVENALTAVRLLAAQAEAQKKATASSRRTAEIALQRYKEGAVSYRDVVETQRTALEIELNLVRTLSERLNASVALIRALGGGWRG